MEYVRCMIGRRYVLAKCGDVLSIFFRVIVRCEIEITVKSVFVNGRRLCRVVKDFLGRKLGECYEGL